MKFKQILLVFLFLLSTITYGYAEIERKYVNVKARSWVKAFNNSLIWEEIKIPTRSNVKIRFLMAKHADATCVTVMLFTGGKARRITKLNQRTGRLKLTSNFLIRTSPIFASKELTTVLVDLPSDRKLLSNDFRNSEKHHKDIRSIIEFLTKNEGACGVYLVGTSRGSLSVAYLATMIKHSNVKGYILTASVEDILHIHGVYEIKKPTLVVHHVDDECRTTPYASAQWFFNNLSKNIRKHFVSVSGGDMPRTKACRPKSQHGFWGVEKKTVKAIVDWILGKTPPKWVSP